MSKTCVSCKLRISPTDCLISKGSLGLEQEHTLWEQNSSSKLDLNIRFRSGAYIMGAELKQQARSKQ